MALVPYPTHGSLEWDTPLKAYLDDQIANVTVVPFNVKSSVYGAVGDGVTDDTAAIQAAAYDAGAAGVGNILFFPPGTYKISSSITIPAGVSVLGSGLASRLQCNGCDGLHMVAPWGSIGPYFIRDLYIFGVASTCTNFAAIRVAGALVGGDRVEGYEISNVRIDSFGYGMFLRNLWRSSIYHVEMVNVYYGFYLAGQNLLLNLNGCNAVYGTPPGTPTGATNSKGFYIDSAFDYNPGGNTEFRSESIHVSSSQFYGFDIGIDHQRCLVASYDDMDLDGCKVYGIRYNQSDGGLRLKGDWIAITGAAQIAGIYAMDMAAGQSKSFVEIDGFHITADTAQAGSVGIHIGDRQNNVTIKNCYIGPQGGGFDFQTADIQATGVVNGNTGISMVDTVCASATPTNSVLIGTTGAVSGRAANLIVTQPILVGAASGGIFSVDPGKEVGYDPITATVNVTGTVPTAPTTIITCPARTFDGLPVLLEFFSPRVVTPNNVAGANIHIGLYESGNLIAELGQLQTPAAATLTAPFPAALRFTPSAGSHTYTIGAWVTSTTGTPAVTAGTGAGGSNAPTFARWTKA
jgi:Pectate lyase superfamily protein